MQNSIIDNGGRPLTYEAVIKKAIADWTKRQPDPLPIPMSEPAMGTLALLITQRLSEAGFVGAKPPPDR